MLTKKDMNKLSGLLYLWSISRNSSKRKASDSLNTSMDTVNKYISELEDELGFKLLASNGRGSQITPQAQEILPFAGTLKSILREMEFVAAANSQVTGLVRVGIEDCITTMPFTQKVLDFFRLYPGLRLQTETCTDMSPLIAQDVDLMLSCQPPSSNDLIICQSKEVQCGLFASQSYIAQFGMPYDRDDLLNNHRFCEHVNYVKYINGWRDLHKDIKHIVYSSNSIHTVKIMIEAGAGIGLLTLNWKNEDLVNVASIMADTDIKLSYPVYLIGHRNKVNLPRVKAIVELLKQMMLNSQ